MTVQPMRLPIAQAVERLITHQRYRRFAIVSQSRCDRATEAFLARQIGYDIEADMAARKAVFRRAGVIRRQIERGKTAGVPQVILDGAGLSIIQRSAMARNVWDEFRKQTQATMEALAAMLPAAYDFAQEVRGFGDLGLAIIIGETGDLRHYSNPAKVWKRLGLAVINGQRQQRKTDKAMAELHGFSPQRRAEVWALADSLFRAQWCGEERALREAILKDVKAARHCADHAIDLAGMKGDPLRQLAVELDIVAEGYPLGPYGEVYLKRRRATLGLGMTNWHAYSDARRIMMKALICDLWRVWHGLLPRYRLEVDKDAA